MYERKIGVVFLGKDAAFFKALADSADRNIFTVLSVISRGENIESALMCLAPEAVVIDESFEGLSPGALISEINKTGQRRHVTMVLSSGSSAPDVASCMEEGADYYLLKPLDPELFWRRLYLLTLDLRDSELSRMTMDRFDIRTTGEKERETLLALYSYGLDPRTKGFSLIKTAVELIADGKLRSGQEEVYGMLGNFFGQSPGNVRRDIAEALSKSGIRSKPGEFMSKAAFSIQERLRPERGSEAR